LYMGLIRWRSGILIEGEQAAWWVFDPEGRPRAQPSGRGRSSRWRLDNGVPRELQNNWHCKTVSNSIFYSGIVSPFPESIGAIDGVFTMKCRSCGATNKQGSKFCKHCGSSLSTSYACPRCHFENLPDSAYCTQCGTRLSFQKKPKGTQKRCQSCGYPNDIEAIYCSCCNQKIAEDSGE